MRSFKSTMVLCSLMLVLAPKPAHAWFELLDYLSGPGKFYGPKVDVRVWCFEDETTAQKVRDKIAAMEKSYADAIDKAIGGVDGATADLVTLLAELKTINEDFYVLDNDRIDRLKMTADRLQADATAVARGAIARPPVQSDVLIGLLEDVAAQLDQLFKAEASISATGIFVSLCSPDRIRTFAFEVGMASMQADSNPAYAHDYTIRLNTFTAALSYRVPLPADRDVIDVGVIGGMYRFSSRGFDTFRGAILEPFVDLHGPTRWVNDPGLKQLGALLTVRVGLVWFPGGFDADQFSAVAAKANRISGREATPSVTVYFNLTPLLSQRSRRLAR